MKLSKLATVLAMALSLSTGRAAADHPLLGTWSSGGEGPGHKELRVRTIDDRGRINGWYCVTTDVGYMVYDFVPGGSNEHRPTAIATERDIVTTLDGVAVSFDLNTTGQVLNLTVAGEGRVRHDDLRRHVATPCTGRLVPLDENGMPSRAENLRTIADTNTETNTDAHPMVGAWVTSSMSGLAMELIVTNVDGDEPQGVFCTLWPSGWMVQFIHENHPVFANAIDAFTTEGGVHFTSGTHHFTFEIDPMHDDKAQYVLERDGKEPHRATLTRLGGTPCASRIVAAPGAGEPVFDVLPSPSRRLSDSPTTPTSAEPPGLNPDPE